MTGRLAGKVVDGKVDLMTRTATGIGAAIAHQFARAGAKVLLHGLPNDPMEDAAPAIQQHGSEAVAYEGD